MNHLNFYSHFKKSERVYLVTESFSATHRFTIGVFVGDEKVLVIDAGLGTDDGLRKYIEGIVGTDKPIICACTHLHPDHTGSAGLFDEAYCSHHDYPKYGDFALNINQRLNDLGAFALYNPEVMEYCQDHYVYNDNVDFKNVDEGDVFNLGGIHIEVIAVPGHTEGSLVFYCKEENIVFTGDAINKEVMVKKLNREGLRNYAGILRRFLSKVNKDVDIYSAHVSVRLDTNVVEELALACEEIADGKTQADPPGEGIFRERIGNRAIRAHYVGLSCIIYNTARFEEV